MLVTGCYLDHNSHSAIVLRIKDDMVTYLTMNVTKPEVVNGLRVYEVTAQRVSLVSTPTRVFTAQYGKYLHNYPVLRAIKIYWRSGLTVTPEAKEAIRVFLIANKTKARRATA